MSAKLQQQFQILQTEYQNAMCQLRYAHLSMIFTKDKCPRITRDDTPAQRGDSFDLVRFELRYSLFGFHAIF